MKYTLDEVMDISEAQYYWLFATASALELRGAMPDYNLVPTNKMVEKLGQPNLHKLPQNNRRKKYDENDIFTEIGLYYPGMERQGVNAIESKNQRKK